MYIEIKCCPGESSARN